MSEGLKRRLRANGSGAHVDEFGKCIGIVQGPTNYGLRQGPEVDVRWLPSRLRYGYKPEDLVLVDPASADAESNDERTKA
jgi:hypothetical protein